MFKQIWNMQLDDAEKEFEWQWDTHNQFDPATDDGYKPCPPHVQLFIEFAYQDKQDFINIEIDISNKEDFDAKPDY